MADELKEKGNAYGKRSIWQWIVIYLVIGVVIYAALYYFIFNKNGANTYNAPVVPKTETQTPTATSVSASQKITVDGNDFTFTPSTITVKQGQPITITFKNNGKYPHNFVITDLNAQSKTIQAGEQDAFTFTPNTTGDFEYICTVPSHAERGMKGILTVQ